MVARLEEALDVKIFDRTKQPVEPTPLGTEVIRQAHKILQQSRELQDLVQKGKENLETRFNLAVIPTVAPYIIPEFITHFKKDFPKTGSQSF